MSVNAFVVVLTAPILFTAAVLLPVLIQSWEREARFNEWCAELRRSWRAPQRYDFDSSSWTGR